MVADATLSLNVARSPVSYYEFCTESHQVVTKKKKLVLKVPSVGVSRAAVWCLGSNVMQSFAVYKFYTEVECNSYFRHIYDYQTTRSHIPDYIIHAHRHDNLSSQRLWNI